LLGAVTRYIALRKRYAAVWRGGAYVPLYAQDKVYVFAPQHDQHTVIVGLNAGSSAVTLDLAVQHLFPQGGLVRAEWSGQPYPITDGQVSGLRLPAREGGVWVREPPS